MFRKALLTTLFALLALAPSAGATIWTPVNSGTSGTISSIVYQSPTRLWYTTTAGTIAFWNGTSFTEASGLTPGENFDDLAFQPTSVPGGPGTAGLVGYAITSNGHIWHSTDGGMSWSKLASPKTRSDCSALSTQTTESELNAVQWEGTTRVALFGDNSTVLLSTNANSGSPTFTEINKVVTGTCTLQGDASSVNFTDATFLPSNTNDALLVDQDFGSLFSSSDGLTSGMKINGDTVNNFTGNPRIAQDPASPNRIWIVDHEPGGAGCGALCLVVSTDGGNTTAGAPIVNDPSPVVGLYDISSAGGTEVTAGTHGEIFTSVDGASFYEQPAEGALATVNWRAEAAYDAAHAAVGGENGALVLTAAANTIPAPVSTAPPTGTSPGTSTPNPTPPGPPTGSQPLQTSTGGAKITVYRVVVVTGRNSRSVPVVVSTTKPRRFTVQILPLKGKKVLATTHLTIKGKHGGGATIHVKLPATLKPGKYFIAVRETTLGGVKVGKLVKVRFTLK